ncbi:thiolase family protein [Mycobacterium intracellulare]|uniref:thiolase family protein n=1 Tax=Mycobacterium intracellulare TaxID=1767 RepID=UPI000BAC21AA|nr:thiolase family protein [Mycobacterium intracellulare]ASW98596.1 thiolase [Mycobacterium intracellulare subsp. chimaera]PBA61195.1 thiolase [Mycobacterium intracellulare subsp. chimaera]PBA61423.1 thiolase [Mycobacterium intracellulare subsp. chimaera]
MTVAHLTGIGVTEFGRHGEAPLADLGVAAARKALADANIDYDEVGEVFTASALAPPQTGMKVALALGRTGIPVTATESASAGGLVALRHAVWAVASGRCQTALAIGYEKTTALEPGGVVPAAVGFWDRFPPQTHYAIEAARWLHDAGCGPEVIAAVAAKSHNQARLNPLAARRSADPVTVDDVLNARMVADPLTKMMCHASVDGGAAVVVTAQSQPRSVSVLAIEQTSWPVDPEWPIIGPVVGPPSQLTLTAQRAYTAARVDPTDVDVVSLHDMCASEEIIALIAMGLAESADVVKLAEAGGLANDGALPTNTDGGCIARGHPIGATGLAQMAEIVSQLRGEAEGRQVRDPRIGLVQAVGGGGSCAAAILSA